MKRLLSTLMAVCLIAMSAWASKTVNGKVVSASDNEPLIGATVQAVGSSQGTATDLNGEFTVTVNDNVTQLRISCVGYKAQVVAVTSYVTVALEEDNTTLEEVVVTAMGITRKQKSLGYAAQQVKADELVRSRTSDVMSSLAGKMAGVQITATSSDPGASNSVIIRGISSLSGSNQPLYVVDGVPLNNTAVFSGDGLNSGFDFGNGANAVNPDDVESMTVLKGAAATALYGSRAANGVILITTKTGKKQKGVGIDYNGGMQWESVLRLPQQQNEFGQGWYGAKTMDENGSWGPRFDGSYLRYGKVYNNSQQRKSYVAIPSNMQDFFDTGVRYSNSISFNGATDASTFYVSLSQLTDDGIIPTSSDRYKKYTFSGRASHRVGKVMLSSSVNYAYNHNSFVTTGQGTTSMYNAIMQTPRDISIAELKDLSNPFNTPGYYYTPYGVTNPYYILENYENKYEAERFYGKLQADYDFAKNFKLIYRFGLDTSTGHHNTGQPNLETLFVGTANGEDLIGETGGVSQQTTRRREINHDLMVTYDNMILEDLSLNALVGFNGNERRMSYLYAAVDNLTIPTWYNLSNSSEIPTVEQYMSKRRLIGVYGQAEFGFKNQLFLTLTARNDWSSTLPSGNRSFFYPGITLSWMFTELLNKEIREYVTFGKLRAAWGKTGNDANVYMTNSVYAQAASNSSGWASSSFPFSKTGVNAYTAGNVLGSQTLSPEMSTETEFGLNMGFLQNRISFDFAWYNRISDKQIFSLNMDPSSGYTAQNTNLGKVRNRGIELLVSVTPVKVGDFQWDLTWNYTKNHNKVLDLPDELGGEALIYGFSGGTGLYAIEGEEMGVFKAYTSQRDDNGNIIVNASTGLPIATSDVVEIGTMNNKYQMGFGTMLRYQSVSLTVNFDYRKGGLMFSRTKDIQYFTGNAMQTAYNDRNPWIVPNSVVSDGNGGYVPNTTPLTPTNIYNYWNNGAEDMDASFLVDKTYLKLRSVALTWDMPSRWLTKTFLTGVSLSVFGNNLFVWTPKSNTFIDPETTSFGNDLEGNFGEYSTNPTSRKIGFNINVKF